MAEEKDVIKEFDEFLDKWDVDVVPKVIITPDGAQWSLDFRDRKPKEESQ